MIQVITKWRVTVRFSDGESVVLFVSDNFASNMLRKLAEIGFQKDPVSLEIEVVR